MSHLQLPGAVVMAVYRPDPFLLERQVRSLQAQTVERWNCYVGIDGRDDATRGVLDRLVADDGRFVVQHFDENVGVYRNFERLLDLLPEDVGWVALADQDDDWYPEKFAVLLPELDAPGAMAVVGRARVVDANGQERGLTERRPGDFLSTLFLNQLTGSLAILRREVVDTALPFPPDSTYAIHDHWLALCAAATGRIVQVDTVVQDYVQHRGNVIGEMKARTVRDVGRELLGSGNPLRYVDEYATGPWEWRVGLAKAASDRGMPPPRDEATVRAIGHGRLTVATMKAVLGHLVRRRLSPVQAVAMLTASARWGRTQRATRA